MAHSLLGYQPGDMILLELENGKRRENTGVYARRDRLSFIRTGVT
jgi:hypothetical protein